MNTLERILTVLLLAAALLVVPRWTSQHPARAELTDIEATVADAREDVDVLRGENERLRQEVLRLADDARSVERRAYDELLYARPDESIFPFDGEDL